MFNKLKIISIPLVILSMLLFFNTSLVETVYADGPTEPGSAWYVNSNWLDPEYAYTKGQNSTGGSGHEIVLDFGRQYFNGTTWGVYLPGSSNFITDYQVQIIATNFSSGFDSTHTVSPFYSTFVHVSTNNDNVGWGQGDSRWYSAGTDWRNMLAGILPVDAVTIAAGNDIESWYGTGYIAYGSDTENWCQAYADADANYSYNRYLLNFGSDCNAEYPSGWSKE